MSIEKISVLLLSILYFLLTVVRPAWSVKNKTGIQPIVFSQTDSRYQLIGNIFKLVGSLSFANIIAFVFFDKFYQLLIPIPFLETINWIFPAGIIFLLFSLVFIVVAQNQMANSWRIGIDTENKSSLITEGLFSVSRNPIYIGLHFCFIGLFLTMPNLLMAIACFLGIGSMHLQVKLEELFLLQQHREEFLKYKKEVRRWI